ncbi:MAG: hypothetical protein IJ748_02995 [Bacteroidales bacterium]|nr:hypothetical protein [Bacteroidales bacterium]
MENFRLNVKNSVSNKFTLNSFPNIDFLPKSDYMDLEVPPRYLVLNFFAIIFVLGLYFFPESLIQRLNILRLKAHFIEKPNKRKALRYSYNGKLGLIRAYNSATILPAICDDITIADKDFLFILKQGYKYGLCNVNNRKVIIPIEYDRIEKHNDYVYCAVQNGEKYYFDLKGNKLQ